MKVQLSLQMSKEVLYILVAASYLSEEDVGVNYRQREGGIFLNRF